MSATKSPLPSKEATSKVAEASKEDKKEEATTGEKKPPSEKPPASVGEGEEDDEDEDDEEYEDEEERLYALSEQAKEEVRGQLRELKAIYRSIKQRNSEIPEQFRVPESDLKLPSEIYEKVYAKIQEECDEVYRIHEYESAEMIIQLEKIKRFYFDTIDTPHIVLKDISHTLQVHTIRRRKITKQFLELVDRNREVIEEESRILREHAARADFKEEETLPPIQRIYAKDIIGEYESKLHTYDIETVHNIRHLERRLSQRYERECAWQALMAKKISPDYIPPEDEEALAKVKAETGAFRLQTSDSYQSEQISISERREKIIEMKILLRERVREFNKMLIEARDEKPKILQECHRLEKEIRKVHVLLPEEYRRKIPPIFDMEPEENPESNMDITEGDVEAEEDSMLAAAGMSNIKEDIMVEFFGAKRPDKSTMDEEGSAPHVPPPAARAARQAKAVDLEYESIASNRCRKCYFTPQTEIEKKRFEVQFYPRLYRQEMLFKDLVRIINYFRERVKYLHDFRVRLEIDSKVKEIGLLTMISELDIAKEFQIQENAVMERMRAQQSECKTAKRHMDKTRKNLNKVTAEIEKLESDLSEIIAEMEVILSQKSRFTGYLRKVFKNKRKKSVVEDDEEEGEGEEEESVGEASEARSSVRASEAKLSSKFSTKSVSGDSMSDIEPSMLNLDVDVCPEHLDRALYTKVCELRDRKTVLLEDLAKFQQSAEKISNDFEEIEKVYQKYEARLEEIREEVRVLQRRRQKRMNDLKLMIILRADQIQCMDMDDLSDMDGDILNKLAQAFPGTSSIIIFPKGGTDDLERRSIELTKKAKEEKDKCKKGRHMLVRLRQELKRAEQEVEILKGIVKKEMTFKFGQEVDLDKVTAMIINLELLDQEMLLDKMKIKQYKERAKVNEDLDDTKYELTKKVKENSKYNLLKAMMLERRRDLEYYIWKNDKAKIDRENKMLAATESGAGDALRSTDSCVTESDFGTITNTQLEKEIEDARKVLKRQTERIAELKEVLRKCRTKTGLPPLIPLCREIDVTPFNKHDQKNALNNARFVKTTKEMPELNQYCRPEGIQCGVQTIYKGNITPGLRKSQSFTLPSLENVEQLAEMETSRVFGGVPSDELNYDYSSGEEEDVAGGAAAVRELQETIAELLPDEADEFMKYLEENDLNNPPNEIPPSPHKSDGSTGGGGEKSHVKSGSTGKAARESLGTSGKTKKSRDKAAGRKSVLKIAEEAKLVTESKIMEKIQRFSLDTEIQKEEIDAMEDFDFLAADVEKAIEIHKTINKTDESHLRNFF